MTTYESPSHPELIVEQIDEASWAVHTDGWVPLGTVYMTSLGTFAWTNGQNFRAQSGYETPQLALDTLAASL